MKEENTSRRNFIKIGGLTAVAAGFSFCAWNLATPLPDGPAVALSSFSYGEKNSEKTMLVAYASAFASSVEVAATIGQTLAKRGFTVDVLPIVSNPQPEKYDGVVVGSAVQYGKWLPEALEFVKKYRLSLQNRVLAAFCVHIANLGNDSKSRENRLAYLDEVKQYIQIPTEAFFGGKFDRRGAALLMPAPVARMVPTIDLLNFQDIRNRIENMPLSYPD